MSHTRVKTTYEESGPYGSTITRTLYCHHLDSNDTVTFYEDDGSIACMQFEEWGLRDKWHAMTLLRFPYDEIGELRESEGVEWWHESEFKPKPFPFS